MNKDNYALEGSEANTHANNADLPQPQQAHDVSTVHAISEANGVTQDAQRRESIPEPPSNIQQEKKEKKEKDKVITKRI